MRHIIVHAVKKTVLKGHAATRRSKVAGAISQKVGERIRLGRWHQLLPARAAAANFRRNRRSSTQRRAPQNMLLVVTAAALRDCKQPARTTARRMSSMRGNGPERLAGGMKRHRQRALKLVLRKVGDLMAHADGRDSDVARADANHSVDDPYCSHHVGQIQAGLCTRLGSNKSDGRRAVAAYSRVHVGVSSLAQGHRLASDDVGCQVPSLSYRQRGAYPAPTAG